VLPGQPAPICVTLDCPIENIYMLAKTINVYFPLKCYLRSRSLFAQLSGNTNPDDLFRLKKEETLVYMKYLLLLAAVYIRFISVFSNSLLPQSISSWTGRKASLQ
jgi:hypothetical protein